MNYTKPAITLIEAAKSVIQGSSNKAGPTVDVSPLHIPTSAAYEADE